MDVLWMVSSGSRKIVVFEQCVCVWSSCTVKVQCMAYRKVSVSAIEQHGSVTLGLDAEFYIILF